jgi:hypothetical protein
VGEISDALEATWGRAVSETQTVKGAYLNEFGESEEISSAQKAIQVGLCFAVLFLLLGSKPTGFSMGVFFLILPEF